MKRAQRAYRMWAGFGACGLAIAAAFAGEVGASVGGGAAGWRPAAAPQTASLPGPSATTERSGSPRDGADFSAAAQHRNAIIDLWTAGTATFGVFVPNERQAARGTGGQGGRGAPGRGAAGGGQAGRGQRGRGQRQPPLYTAEGGARLAQNPLYDFVFLNLEGAYDAAAVAAIAEGLRGPAAVGYKALLVRIPTIERDGEEATRARVREVLEMGADGVVFPHVRGPEEARLAVGMMREAGADLWSPANPDGEHIAMIMIEDPDSLARLDETAAVEGIGILACGIGSLTGALGGDREAAEAGNQRVLSAARRIGVADMITANADDVGERVAQGFLALLMQGSGADDAIEIGRAAAGRDGATPGREAPQR